MTEINDYNERDILDVLLSIRNTIDLAQLAIDKKEYRLLPTALEDAYIKLQELVDDYCIVEAPRGKQKGN